MSIYTERIDYNSFALSGLDSKLKEMCGKCDYTAVGCHRGVRRSRAAMGVLMAARMPLANNPMVSPSINYADFLDYKFEVGDFGLVIPDKTSFPFTRLVLFHDGGREERQQIRQIRQILDVEAKEVLNQLILAEVRDQEGLMGLA